MYLVHDGHVTATLNVISPFHADGRPLRGTYPKDTPEDRKASATWEFATSLLRLEDAEAVIAETDLVKRGDLLRQDKYRGALLYAARDESVNLAELHQRFVDAKAGYDKAMAETTGGPTHGQGTYDPSTTEAKPGQSPAVDTRPMWQQVTRPDGSPYASKAEWRADGSPTS